MVYYTNLVTHQVIVKMSFHNYFDRRMLRNGDSEITKTICRLFLFQNVGKKLMAAPYDED